MNLKTQNWNELLKIHSKSSKVQRRHPNEPKKIKNKFLIEFQKNHKQPDEIIKTIQVQKMNSEERNVELNSNCNKLEMKNSMSQLKELSGMHHWENQSYIICNIKTRMKQRNYR